LARLRRAASGPDADIELSAAPMAAYLDRFVEAIADDLGTPRAIAVAHDVASADDLDPGQRRALLLDFDRVLGLGLELPAEPDEPLPAGADELLKRRAAAREARDFAASDALRDELAAIGVEVRDTPEGQETKVRG